MGRSWDWISGSDAWAGRERPGADHRLAARGLRAAGADRDARHFQLVREHEIDRIVVGLPVHTSRREGELAARALAWGRWLVSVTGLPVVYVDERYTSVEADNLMIESGLKRESERSCATSWRPRSCSRATSTRAVPRSRPAAPWPTLEDRGL